jgi:hypothetical protein
MGNAAQAGAEPVGAVREPPLPPRAPARGAPTPGGKVYLLGDAFVVR